MLFRREQYNLNLNKYIEKQWENFEFFLQDIQAENGENFLSANGFHAYIEKEQFSKSMGIFFFNLNEKYFAFFCSSLQGELNLLKESDEMKLEKIILLKPSVKQSVIFENNQFAARSSNYYHNYDVNLPIDIQFFNYDKEQKILFSKPGLGNINLYFSFVVEKMNQKFRITKTESLNQEIKNLYLSKILDERMLQLKKS
jgi:hypothetical protein